MTLTKLGNTVMDCSGHMVLVPFPTDTASNVNHGQSPERAKHYLFPCVYPCIICFNESDEITALPKERQLLNINLLLNEKSQVNMY